LSVAARLLGAKEVCVVDNDYLAINSTNSNFQLNFGNLKNLNTYLGSFNEVILKNQLKQFDVVLCNILAEIIKEISKKHIIKKGILMKSLRVAFFGSLSGPDLIQSWELFSEIETDRSRIERCLKLT